MTSGKSEGATERDSGVVELVLLGMLRKFLQALFVMIVFVVVVGGAVQLWVMLH